jgi:hypothetical protein
MQGGQQWGCVDDGIGGEVERVIRSTVLLTLLLSLRHEPWSIGEEPKEGIKKA